MDVRRLRAGRGKLATLVLAVCLILVVVIAVAVSRHHRDHHDTSQPSRALPSSSAPLAPDPTSSATAPTTSKGTISKGTRSAAAYKAELTKSIAANGGTGTVSVAAVNLTTGAHFVGGSTHGQWIASDYKLLLVESLLLKQHGDLSSSERGDAALALEHSDNAAGYRLYLDLGGQSGMMQQLRQLGVKHFNPGVSDPTLSTTSASDLVQVLRALVDPSPLSTASRDYVLGLLRQVESDQRWGIGAAATGGDFVNKNGWLSIDNDNPAGETDNGLWAVNSMGIVDVHGQKVLMAVMSQHNDDFADGIKRVETLAKMVAGAVAP